MRKRTFAFAVAFVITTSTLLFGQTGPQPPTVAQYLMPPKEIVEAFDAPPLPQAMLSPSKQVIALISRRAYPTIADLSQPILRLAGARVNPKTNGPQRTAGHLRDHAEEDCGRQRSESRPCRHKRIFPMSASRPTARISRF